MCVSENMGNFMVDDLTYTGGDFYKRLFHRILLLCILKPWVTDRNQPVNTTLTSNKYACPLQAMIVLSAVQSFTRTLFTVLFCSETL